LEKNSFVLRVILSQVDGCAPAGERRATEVRPVDMVGSDILGNDGNFSEDCPDVFPSDTLADTFLLPDFFSRRTRWPIPSCCPTFAT